MHSYSSNVKPQTKGLKDSFCNSKSEELLGKKLRATQLLFMYNNVQRVNPRDPKGARKWYPILKSVGQVDEHEVAKLVSDETTLNPKEAEMAVYQLEKVMERLLLDGHTVQLGELGSFSLTITGEACRGEKEVTPDKIKKVNLRFRAGKGIKAALAAAKFRPAEDMLSKKK